MKKRLATLLSASMIISSLMMPATSLSVFADDFTDDTEIIEDVSDDMFTEESSFEEEFEIDTESFEEETESFEEETETVSETETEENEKYESSGSDEYIRWTFNNGVLTISSTGNYKETAFICPLDGKDKASIKEVVVNKGITGGIGEYAFPGCENLVKVTLPEGLTWIGNGAFEYCSSLTTINIPSTVEYINAMAFTGCGSLKSIKLPEGLQIIGMEAFSYTGLTSIIIPDSIVYIDNAFEHCRALKKVVLGKNVSTIGTATFASCTSLSEITLPDSVEVIDRWAFENCSGLRTLTIPANVELIGNSAFKNCKDLTLTFKGDKIDIDQNAFAETTGIKFIVKDGSDALAYAKAHNIPYEIIGSQQEQIEAFVTRMYSTCLNRKPDATGLAYWVNLLTSGKESGASAAHGFVFSNEANAKNLCNSCFLDQMYNCFMGRSADSNGKNYWLNEMSKGKTRADVFEGFVVSNEFKKICGQYQITVDNGKRTGKPGFLEGDCKICGAKNKTVLQFIERMYTTCLGRGSDKGGRQYWLDELKKGKTGLDLALGFLTSNEIQKKNLSDGDFIDVCYKAFFGRNADKGGKDYWIGQIKKGSTREDLIKGFAASNEFKALCIEYGIPAK